MRGSFPRGRQASPCCGARAAEAPPQRSGVIMLTEVRALPRRSGSAGSGSLSARALSAVAQPSAGASELSRRLAVFPFAAEGRAAGRLAQGSCGPLLSASVLSRQGGTGAGRSGSPAEPGPPCPLRAAAGPGPCSDAVRRRSGCAARRGPVGPRPRGGSVSGGAERTW